MLELIKKKQNDHEIEEFELLVQEVAGSDTIPLSHAVVMFNCLEKYHQDEDFWEVDNYADWKQRISTEVLNYPPHQAQGMRCYSATSLLLIVNSPWYCQAPFGYFPSMVT